MLLIDFLDKWTENEAMAVAIVVGVPILLLLLLTFITNSGEWRASVCLYMYSVDTVIFNPLHRVITPKDELWPLPWWPTFITWKSRCSTSSIGSNILQGCILLWVMWLTTVNLDYTPSLWEAHFTCKACGSSTWTVCSLASKGEVTCEHSAQHKSGSLQLNSSYFTPIFYLLHWNRCAPKCLGGSFYVLNIICSQIIPCMALWGIL